MRVDFLCKELFGVTFSASDFVCHVGQAFYASPSVWLTFVALPFLFLTFCRSTWHTV